VTVDALGNPLRWILTGGEIADITQAQALIADLCAQMIVADKGYDADAFVALIAAAGAEAVIPPRRHRKTPRAYDRDVYKDRNVVERFFSRLKQFRRIATRYEKLARNFTSMINLACTYLWLM
jgi:transposase